MGEGKSGRLVDSSLDVNWLLPPIDVCVGIDDCGALCVTEPLLIFEVVKGCEPLLAVRLPTAVEPCENGDDAEAPLVRELLPRIGVCPFVED